MAILFPKLLDVAAMQRIADGDFVVIKESVASIDQSIKQARRSERGLATGGAAERATPAGTFSRFKLNGL